MTSQAFFNHNALPAQSVEDARVMMTDIITSLSELVSEKLCLNGIISLNDIFDYELTEEYTLGHAMGDGSLDRDQILFWQRMSHWFPFWDELAEHVGDLLDRCEISPPTDTTCRSPDIIAAAHLQNGFITSFPIDDIWSDSTVQISIQECDANLDPIGEAIQVNVCNLSGAASYEVLATKFRERTQQYQVENWPRLFPDIQRTATFLDWLENSQTELTQKRVMETVNHIKERGVNLGRPFVDQINASAHQNMKELRVTVGGCNPLRILFAFDINRQPILLVAGFKDGNEWYDQNIPIADELFTEHQDRLAGHG